MTAKWSANKILILKECNWYLTKGFNLIGRVDISLIHSYFDCACDKIR